MDDFMKVIAENPLAFMMFAVACFMGVGMLMGGVFRSKHEPR